MRISLVLVPYLVQDECIGEMASLVPSQVPVHKGKQEDTAKACQEQQGGGEMPQEGEQGGNWEAELASQRDVRAEIQLVAKCREM